MKKNVIIGLFTLFVATFALSSCNECQDCTVGGVTTEYCQKDFDNKDDYETAIDVIEAAGGDCEVN